MLTPDVVSVVRDQVDGCVVVAALERMQWFLEVDIAAEQTLALKFPGGGTKFGMNFRI